MALTNILKQTDQVLLADGSPAGGGSVFLYEPGTTTPITSYRDSGLVVPHSNPVKLSGAGRANIWINRDADMVIQDRNGTTILTADNINPDSLDASESGGLVPNGSFEVDSDSNNVPDGYTLASEAGASNSRDNTQSTSGSWSMRFTSTGSGGGSIITTDFFPVNDVDQLRVNVDLFSTVAGVRNIVRVEWFDVSQVAISNTDAYDSTANPTSWTTQNLFATPPVGARFAKLRLIGIDPSVALAGITYYDNLSVFYPAVVSGVFDNITIQNNQIITTNLNGSLELGPNGTGQVNVNNNTNVSLGNLGAFNVGTDDPSANGHMGISRSTIQAKTNGTTAGNMSINPFGGILTVTATGSEFRVASKTYLSEIGSVDLTNDDHPLNIGPYTSAGNHLAMDRTQIQAKANITTAGTLNLNRLGGDVEIGLNSTTRTTINSVLFADAELRADGNGDVDLTNTLNAVNVGATDPAAERHIAMDERRIQCKDDATTAAQLDLNALGGNVRIGNTSTTEYTLFRNLVRIAPNALVDLVDTANALNIGAGDPNTLPHIAFDANDIQSKATATTTDQLNIQRLGGLLNLGAQSGTGEVRIFRDGQRRVRFDTNVMYLQGDTNADPTTGTGWPDTAITLQSADSNDFATIGFIGGAGNYALKFRNLNYGGNVRLEGTDLLGTLQDIVVGDPDAGTQIYYNGVSRIATTVEGINVQGVVAQDAEYHFFAPFGFDGQIGILEASGGALLRVENGGNGSIIQTDAAGALQDVWIGLDRNGSVTLYRNGDAKARTTTDANGAFEVDSGSGFERVLTESDTAGKLYLANSTTDEDRTSTTTPTASANLDIPTFDETGYYEIEIFIRWQNVTSTTQGIRLTVAGSNPLGGSFFLGQYAGSNLPQTEATHEGFQIALNSQITLNKTTTLEQGLHIKGVMNCDNASLGVGITWAQNSSSANPTRILAGSWIKARKLPS